MKLVSHRPTPVWHLAGRVIGCMVIAAALLGAANASEPRKLAVGEIYREHASSVVQVVVEQQNGPTVRGTGFFVQPGVVATSYHLVRYMAKGHVVFGDSGKFAPVRKVLAGRAETDLALVSVPDSDVPPIQKYNSTPPEPGDWVFIIGNPGGLRNSFTFGMVSAHRRFGRANTLQLSTPAVPGNSGSPVFNEKGEVIAVIRSARGQGTDLVFATPVDQLHELQREVVAQGEAGAKAQPLPSSEDARRAGKVIPSAGIEAGSAAVDDTIRIGVPDRVTARATAFVFQAMLERMFPYRIELVAAKNEQIFKDMAAENGRIDIHPEIWLPNHKGLWDRYAPQRQRILSRENGHVGFEGFCVPGYVADRHDIHRVEDLRRPEVARLFDSDGDGRGEMWIGSPDWRGAAIRKVKARDYGFAERFDLRSGPEEVFLKRLKRQIAAKRPVVFACYGPHWVIQKYDLAVLKEPPPSPGCFRMVDPALDEHWYRKSVAKCEGPLPKIFIGFSSRLRQQAPAVARFLLNLELDHRIVSEWAMAFQEAGAPPAATARNWVRTNELEKVIQEP